MDTLQDAGRVSGTRQMLGFGALYFAQGYPLGVLIIAMPLVGDKAGVSSSVLGLGMAFAMIPLFAKPLVAPLLDRYWSRPSWMRLAQGSMVIIGAILYMLALFGVPLWMLTFGAAFLFSGLGAIQDTATDGIAVVTVLPEIRARVNAIMGAGITIGGGLGGSLGSWFVAHDLLALGFVSLAVVAALAYAGSWLIREAQPQWRSQSEGYLRLLASAFREKLVRHGALLLLLIGATGLAAGFIPLLLKNRLGLSEEYVGAYIMTLTMISGIAGSGLAAIFADRLGRKRAPLLGVIVIVGAQAALAALVITEGHLSLITVGVCLAVQSAAASFMFAALYGVLMGLCTKQKSSTQFAIIMGFGQIGNAFGMVIGGLFLELGWATLFIAEAAFSTLAVPGILRLLPRSEEPNRKMGVDEDLIEADGDIIGAD